MCYAFCESLSKDSKMQLIRLFLCVFLALQKNE